MILSHVTGKHLVLTCVFSGIAFTRYFRVAKRLNICFLLWSELVVVND